MKGRVVVVGMVGMTIDREPFYKRELDLRLSMSYGPGRYDPAYEIDGHDYPFPFVRWTEQRNMEAFLELVAAGRVTPARLVTHRFPIEEAEQAYKLMDGDRALSRHPAHLCRRARAAAARRRRRRPPAARAPGTANRLHRLRQLCEGGSPAGTEEGRRRGAAHRGHRRPGSAPMAPPRASASPARRPIPRKRSAIPRSGRSSSRPATTAMPPSRSAPCGPARTSSSRSRWR